VFAPEDEITLKGYEKTKDGKTTLVVTEVTTKDKRVVKLRGDDFNPVWAKVTTANGHGEKIVTYSGKVKSFEKMDPAMVFITTDKGDIQAELAPMTFIEENKLLFAPDDMIVVKGFEKMRDGKRLFVVTEVTTKDKRVVKLRNDARTPVWVKVDRPTETRDLTGAVTVVETMDTPDGRLVTIKTDTGEQVIALGPGTYLEKHRYVLTPGERIVVKGYEVNRGGKRVFLALNVKKGDAIWKFRRDDGTILWE
jgi:outer membrane protein assembly factor BamB